MTSLPTPHVSEHIGTVENDRVRATDNWYRFWQQLQDSVTRALKALGEGVDGAAVKEQTFSFGGFIEVVDDKTYTLWLNVEADITLTKVTTKSSTGTCTFTVSIDGTPLGGDPNSVSTSEVEEGHDEDNEAPAGSTVTAAVTSNSSCENLAFNIEYTRNLA